MKNLFLLLVMSMTVSLLSPAASAAPAADVPSVLVKTASLQHQAMSDTLTVYGSVMPVTGATENISFPRPVQIVRLLVATGQVVKRGEPLLVISTDASAIAAYRQATSAETYAQSELKRMEDLMAQQLATQSQVAAARKTLLDAQANLAAQRGVGNGIGKQTVTSPFEGLVVSIAVQQGDRIQSGAPAMQLARSGRLRTLMGVEPEDVSRVRTGMAIRLVSVFGSDHVLNAKVSKVFGTINPQTRLVDVEAVLPGAAIGFLPGMQVRGVIDIGAKSAWVVPRSAVLRDALGTYLFQVKDGQAKRVAVSTDVENKGVVAVSGPLDGSLKVVVLGNYELKDGMPVREGVQ
ncbi:MAG: efflux RND transporter periplasmic adaptor subunit [Glaciimonas sp.]|nr:efflux RND transporter periplasmic adaptor subunit [Glaciimonas sp.]